MYKYIHNIYIFNVYIHVQIYIYNIYNIYIYIYILSSGKLIRFCEMGDINQEIEIFKLGVLTKKTVFWQYQKKLAKYVNVFAEFIQI